MVIYTCESFVPGDCGCVTVSYLCLHRAVGGVVGDGDASCPAVAGLCGICNPFCDFCLLCHIDCLHSTGYGGPLSFPPRAPSALVRMGGQRRYLPKRPGSVLSRLYKRPGAIFRSTHHK